jgi:hypothetical protein
MMKKYPKGLDEIKCKHVDELIQSEFSDYFPLGNKPIEGVKVPTDRFMPRENCVSPIERYTQKQNQTSNFDVPLH